MPSYLKSFNYRVHSHASLLVRQLIIPRLLDNREVEAQAAPAREAVIPNQVSDYYITSIIAMSNALKKSYRLVKNNEEAMKEIAQKYKQKCILLSVLVTKVGLIKQKLEKICSEIKLLEEKHGVDTSILSDLIVKEISAVYKKGIEAHKEQVSQLHAYCQLNSSKLHTEAITKVECWYLRIGCLSRQFVTVDSTPGQEGISISTGGPWGKRKRNKFFDFTDYNTETGITLNLPGLTK